jgi:RsmE family RNA methyltransferase
VHRNLSSFLTEALPGLQKKSNPVCLLDASGSGTFSRFADVTDCCFESPLLFIGPERGFTESEKNLILQSGAEMVRISSTTLRVEFAVFAALAQMEIFRLK